LDGGGGVGERRGRGGVDKRRRWGRRLGEERELGGWGGGGGGGEVEVGRGGKAGEGY